MRRWLPLLALAVATACGQAQVGSAPRPKERDVAVTTLTAQELADSQRALGLDLLAKACADKPHANVAISPASVGIALGMLDAGARGAALAQVAKVLHLPPWSEPVLAAFRAQREALGRLKEVQTSNHLYLRPGLDAQPKTLEDISSGFEALPEQLDFQKDPAHAVDVINAQVSKDTKGLIPKLLADLSRDTAAVLTNAVHLDAKWAVPFDEAFPADFTTAAGSTKSVPTMHSHAFFPHRTTDGWDSVQLDYKGGALSAFAVLPPKGSTCDATSAVLKALTAGKVKDRVATALPKLKLTQSHELLDPLLALGLPKAGYDGLGSNLELSQVIQKVVVDVDEAGTKAAAATAVVAVATGAIAGPPPVVFDRPFLLLLQDTVTGTPLFLVRVADPTAA